MGSLGQRPERRRSYRISADGTAFLWRNDRLAGRYELSDLSIGGCRLTGDTPCPVGRGYQLRLHVADRGELELPARVVRSRPNGEHEWNVGLRFVDHRRASEDDIHDWITRAIESGVGRGRVLVVDPDDLKRRRLRAALRKLGFSVAEARMPLDALWELEQQPSDIHSVFAAAALGRCEGHEVLELIAARYPNVRRILVGGARKTDATVHAVLAGAPSPARLRKVLPPQSQHGDDDLKRAL